MAESPHPASDHEIAGAETLDRARASDSDALADLWAVYQPQVLALLRSRGAESADDIASQVWLEVGRSIGRFEGDGVDFRRWIFTIAGRRAIDERRRARRRREVSVESMTHVPPRHQNDERWATSFESAQAILSSLSPAVAEVIMLRIIFDMSVSRVAEATGRSEGHVRVLTHRGLSLLRERADSEPQLWAGTRFEIDEAAPVEPAPDEDDLYPPVIEEPEPSEVELDVQPVAAHL